MKFLTDSLYRIDFPEEDNKTDFFFKHRKIFKGRFRQSLMYGILGKMTLAFYVAILFPGIFLKKYKKKDF